MIDLDLVLMLMCFDQGLPHPDCVTYGPGWAVLHTNDVTWWVRV